jgi:hypothetical protein
VLRTTGRNRFREQLVLRKQVVRCGLRVEDRLGHRLGFGLHVGLEFGFGLGFALGLGRGLRVGFRTERVLTGLGAQSRQDDRALAQVFAARPRLNGLFDVEGGRRDLLFRFGLELFNVGILRELSLDGLGAGETGFVVERLPFERRSVPDVARRSPLLAHAERSVGWFE